MLTTASKEMVSNVMGGASNLIPSYLAIGNGSSTMASGDTALVSETDRNELSLTDTSVTNDVTYVADFSANEISGTTVQEFGLFNASTGPTMYDRNVITPVTFDGSRELQIQVTHRYALSSINNGS